MGVDPQESINFIFPGHEIWKFVLISSPAVKAFIILVESFFKTSISTLLHPNFHLNKKIKKSKPTTGINLPLFSTVLPSNSCCFCPV